MPSDQRKVPEFIDVQNLNPSQLLADLKPKSYVDLPFFS